MPETLRLGQVACDFLGSDDFLAMCKQWIWSNKLHHVVTLNPEMVMEAESNAEFRSALNRADIRVPDGAGLIWAHWYIRSQFWSLVPSLISFSFRTASRITGVDTVLNLARLATESGAAVYLLGGGPEELQRTAKLLENKFPSLKVFTSPPHIFDINGPANIMHDIQKRAPAVLLVAYGAPKQSVWIERHRQNLPSVKIAVGVGGAFDILSEAKPRAPQMFLKFNLEWLWRLILEPSRLPRIWRAVVLFPLLIHRQKRHAAPVYPH